MSDDTPAKPYADKQAVERVARHIQLWWMTQKHEPMHQDDACNLARAAIAALVPQEGVGD